MKNRRSILILDKDFQYGQILMFVLVAIVAANATIIVGYLVMGDFFIIQMRTFGWAVAAIEIFLLLGVIIYGTKASHRIAGPVFVIKRCLKALSTGDLSCRAQLRRGDKLHDLCDAFNSAAAELDSRIIQLRTEFEDLEDLLKQKKDTGEQIDRIKQSLSYFYKDSDENNQ